MKSAATTLVRVGVIPASCGVALAIAIAVQLTPARVEASSLVRPPIDAASILPPLPAPVRVMQEDAQAGALFELTLRTHGKGALSRQLMDAGARTDDALRAAALLQTRLGNALGAGTDLKLGLGPRALGGGRAIYSLSVITDVGMERIERRQEALVLAAPATARRISATVEGGSYWSLRAAGLAPEVAAEAARLADQRLGAGPGAAINAVVGNRPARFGTGTAPRLLFLAVERAGRPTRRLLAWPGSDWIDPDRLSAAPSAIARPVAGRVTSGFGARFHPILHFFRAHRGLDFAARRGEPVRAAADGCVTNAGWRGGYGRQVRLVHRGELGSSYSHLNSLTVSEGQCVRRGEVIGLAGASGLATGPHLHFELYRAGQAIDPLRQMATGGIDVEQRAAIAARLVRLQAATTI